MKNNYWLLVALASIILQFNSYGQELFTDKYSSVVTGNGFLELSEIPNTSQSQSQVRFNGAFNHFIENGLFVGGGVNLHYQSIGSDNAFSVGLGPQLGYMLAFHSTGLYPFLSVDYRYFSNIFTLRSPFGNITGTNNTHDLSATLGGHYKIKDHFGAYLGLSYHRAFTINPVTAANASSNEAVGFSYIALNIGFSGLFYGD